MYIGTSQFTKLEESTPNIFCKTQRGMFGVIFDSVFRYALWCLITNVQNALALQDE